jgi:hypothetical protein
MGISVIGLQIDGEPYPVFSAEEFDSQLCYLGVTCLIGFNSRAFDDKVMAANGSTRAITRYDLLEEVRVAAGYTADHRSVPKGYSYSLDAIARANGVAKSGNGALAPRQWQNGEFRAVINYCLNDVEITSKLLYLGQAGRLIDPNTGRTLQLAEVPT